MFNDPRIALLLKQFQGGGLGMAPPQIPPQMSPGPAALLQPAQQPPRQMPSAQPPMPGGQPQQPQPAMGGGMPLAMMMAMQGKQGAGVPPWRKISPAAMEGVIEGMPGAEAKAYLQDLAPGSFLERLGLTGLFGGY